MKERRLWIILSTSNYAFLMAVNARCSNYKQSLKYLVLSCSLESDKIDLHHGYHCNRVLPKCRNFCIRIQVNLRYHYGLLRKRFFSTVVQYSIIVIHGAHYRALMRILHFSLKLNTVCLNSLSNLLGKKNVTLAIWYQVLHFLREKHLCSKKYCNNLKMNLKTQKNGKRGSQGICGSKANVISLNAK